MCLDLAAGLLGSPTIPHNPTRCYLTMGGGDDVLGTPGWWSGLFSFNAHLLVNMYNVAHADDDCLFKRSSSPILAI